MTKTPTQIQTRLHHQQISLAVIEDILLGAEDILKKRKGPPAADFGCSGSFRPFFECSWCGRPEKEGEGSKLIFFCLSDYREEMFAADLFLWMADDVIKRTKQTLSVAISYISRYDKGSSSRRCYKEKCSMDRRCGPRKFDGAYKIMCALKSSVDG